MGSTGLFGATGCKTMAAVTTTVLLFVPTIAFTTSMLNSHFNHHELTEVNSVGKVAGWIVANRTVSIAATLSIFAAGNWIITGACGMASLSNANMICSIVLTALPVLSVLSYTGMFYSGVFGAAGERKYFTESTKYVPEKSPSDVLQERAANRRANRKKRAKERSERKPMTHRERW